MVEHQFLDTHKAAAFMDISPALLEKWRILRIGPPYKKIGRMVRYDRRELEEYMAAMTVQPREVAR